jgi:hypothetical protein
MQERVEASEKRETELVSLVGNLQDALNSALGLLGALSGFDPSTIQIDMSQVPTGNLDQTRVTGNWDKSVVTAGSVSAAGGVGSTGTGTFDTGVTSTGMYAQSVAGMGGFRTVSVALNGVTGGLTSSAKFKTDIVDAEIPLEALRKLRVVFYRYLAQVPFDQAREPINLGLIAEEVDALGLTWLVDYDDEGAPYALNERMLPYVGILLAQLAHDRIDRADGSISPKE